MIVWQWPGVFSKAIRNHKAAAGFKYPIQFSDEVSFGRFFGITGAFGGEGRIGRMLFQGQLRIISLEQLNAVLMAAFFA